MVVIAAAAFLLVTYSRLVSRHLFQPSVRLLRRYCHRRDPPHLPSLSDIESPPYDSSDGFYAYSPYGLDDSVIKSMPLSIYTTKKKSKSKGDRKRLIVLEAHDCAVCLLEFEENDYIRTLPQCCHSFHVDCIDMWLRSHANCPLCRASIFFPPESSPLLTPVMASRIRPSFDDGSLFLESMFLEPLMETPTTERRRRRISVDMASPEEIVSVAAGEISERMMIQSVDRGDLLLKRSYSLGFERNIASERLVLEPVTASPWRYNHRRGGGGGGGFWRRTTSPWSSITKSRAFSFRSNRGTKSPMFRRGRGFSFLPLSESGSSSIRFGGGGSSRRSKSIASPLGGTMRYSSSRMRCGDPEALLSPERYGGRR